MKIIITPLQFKLIVESEYNYHIGDLGGDLDSIKPYGSDNIYRMQGRGTGHFGSGVYFSTYQCGDKQEFDDKGVDIKNLTKIKDKVYRIDFDLYKNLYRVKSNSHGDALFKTLKEANNTFYKNIDYHSGVLDMNKDLVEDYLRLKNNLKYLSLRLPDYKGFIRLIKEAGEDMRNKKNAASFSTRIMEYNNFNGVNVSGIYNYDNTLHGSVIYDISQLGGELVEIKDPSLYCSFNKGVLSSSNPNVIQNYLRGNYHYVFSHFDEIPDKDKLFFLKRVPIFVKSSYLEKLSESEREKYYKYLNQKLKRHLIETPPGCYEIIDLIQNNQLDIIFDVENKIDNISMLVWALNHWYCMGEENLNIIKNSINRELDDEEQELMNQIYN